jgi:hypothetical protein
MLSSERPSVLQKGDDLALDLSFYDQFNNEHPVGHPDLPQFLNHQWAFA